jgi:hypothetical protein
MIPVGQALYAKALLQKPDRSLSVALGLEVSIVLVAAPLLGLPLLGLIGRLHSLC